MSTFGVQIHQDENGGRRGKALNTRSTAQGQKRAALGVITNQVNHVRVQPSRAAKPKVPSGIQDENAFAKKSNKTFGTQGQFSLYVDEPQAVPATKSQPPQKTLKVLNTSTELTDAVTSITQPRVPLIEVPSSPDISCFENSVSEESPMVLDVDASHEVKKPVDRELAILTVPEYAEDIYKYLREAETKNRPKMGYMKRQQDITCSMRNILVDWLVEVSEEYKLQRETLFLTVSYIDRFLSKISVLRGKLQLVGAASMFLAAKYEEIYPPDVTEFAYITDDTYTKEQVLRMEHLILKVLSFDVAVPTINWFCEDFVKSCNGDDKLKSLTMFLAELTLVDMDPYLKYLPTITASASLCLARYSLGMEPWPQTMVKKTGYEIGHFADCLKDLHKTYKSSASHPQQSIIEKYKSEKYQSVSDFTKNPVPTTLTLSD